MPADKAKVLVIDDDPVSLKQLVAILQRNSYEVVSRSSGREALGYLQKGEPPNLIISDVMMPGIDGFQLLRLVRSDRRLKRIPFILCTTLNDLNSVIQGRNLGANDYMVKPIKPEVLVAKVRKVLEAVPGPVLVVDNEEVIRKLLVNIITREGLEAIEAASAAEALDHAEKRNVSMVFADVELPDLAGLNLLTGLKKKRPSMPVFFMADSGSQRGKEDLLAAGAAGFIAKPFHNTAIISKIEALVGAQNTEPRSSMDGQSIPLSQQLSGSHGRLEDLNLIDLLQALGPGRKTAKVTVTFEGSRDSLVMYLNDGQICHATYNNRSGADAVYAAIEWTDGTWKVEPILPGGLPEPNNDLPNESILMEGCRLLDERRRDERVSESQ